MDEAEGAVLVSEDRERIMSGLDEIRLDFLRGLTTIADELAEEEARFRDIVSRMEDAIVVLDRLRTVVYANPAAEVLFGKSLTELVGEELGIPVIVGARTDVTIRRPNGTETDAEVSVGRTTWEDQEIFVVCLREEGVLHTDERLALERYGLALGAGLDGVWDWNLTTDEVFFCSGFRRMLGDDAADLVASPVDWLGRVHAEDLDRLRTAIDAYLQGRSSTFRSSFRIRHRDEGYRWVLARGTAVRDDWGEPYRFVGVQTDIDALLSG